jgi:hypothetical protein
MRARGEVEEDKQRRGNGRKSEKLGSDKKKKKRNNGT